MGLDVSFNRAQAEAAGLLTKVTSNGEPEYIEGVRAGLKDILNEAPESYDSELCHLAWLEREDLYIRVPNRIEECWLHAGAADSDNICVRANRWGDNYTPLTQWLERHGIEWSEF